ncbi:hypothetical protein VNO77_05110 [Canavalia gladiata]|uniref:Uncharacterized protein n=1 Tax=Canavalia gladiata TaxID=3824 RepID=A0AAN9MXT0_CANGL
MQLRNSETCYYISLICLNWTMIFGRYRSPYLLLVHLSYGGACHLSRSEHMAAMAGNWLLMDYGHTAKARFLSPGSVFCGTDVNSCHKVEAIRKSIEQLGKDPPREIQ